MKFIPFDLEHAQSIWEQKVEFNLTESGVHPITLNELIGDDQDLFDKLLRLEINYPHVNGIPRLRELIASLYEGAATDNVLVTVGAALSRAALSFLKGAASELRDQGTYEFARGVMTQGEVHALLK